MLRALMLCSPRLSRHLARIVTRTPHTASIREVPGSDTALREVRGYPGMHLADLLPRSWIVRRRWRELGLLEPLSSLTGRPGFLRIHGKSLISSVNARSFSASPDTESETSETSIRR